MRPSNPGYIIPQDTATSDAVDEVIISQPISQDEVDELTYGDDRPAENRIARLRELADDLRVRAAGEIGDDDAATLLASIEVAISTLESKSEFVGEPGMLTEDALDHRETLSPDSDELQKLEEEDEESVVLDLDAHDDDVDDSDDDEDDEDDEDTSRPDASHVQH